MSVEEKIRRAEEIYNRRNGNQYIPLSANRKIKREPSMLYRMIKQIIICFMIYGVFYVVNNKEYFLSQEFNNQVQEIVSKNETLNNTYNWVIDWIQKYWNQNQKEEKQTESENLEQNQSNQTSEVMSSQDLKTNGENIGGSEEETQETEKTQEQKDIENIKSTISFINPIQGTISSTFGWRTPTTATVPKYHTGLDIAAATGTIIQSATDGKVILASSEGDYGKHYKIQIEDVILIYAHCSKLYLNEGDTVQQGQEIAEVGSTGNSTGPHLHFEIRKEERLVDPQLILDI